MSMLTISLMYLMLYVFTLSAFFIFIAAYNGTSATNSVHIKIILMSASKYHPQNFIFKLLFIQLSGLAPSFLFFIKFNFFITCLNTSHLFTVFVIFLNLLLTTFFYLQLVTKTPQKINTQVYNIIFPKQKNIYLKKATSHFSASLFCVATVVLSSISVIFLPSLFCIVTA